MSGKPNCELGSAKPTVMVDVGACTDVGPGRAQNQDAVVVPGAVGLGPRGSVAWSGQVPPAGVTTAVVDGMGGHAGGAEAAAMVAAALVTVRPAHPGGTLDGDDGLDPNAEWAVRYSGAQVFTDAAWCGSTTVEDTLAAAWKAWFEGLSARVQAAGEALGTPEMGATTAVLGVTERGVTVVNVGDCRVYWLNHGRLGPLSTDDRTGDPRSSTVTQAIGGSKRIDPHFYPIAPHPPGSTRFVLCSDGVWGALDQGALRDLSAAGGRPEQVAEAIVQGACRAGARDNCSAVVADVHVGPPELGQPGLGGEDIAAGAAFPVPAEQPPARQTRRWAWGTRTRGDEL